MTEPTPADPQVPDVDPVPDEPAGGGVVDVLAAAEAANYAAAQADYTPIVEEVE